MSEEEKDALLLKALGGSGGSSGPADHMPQIKEINGVLYYWDPDSPDSLIPLADQPGQAAPFNDYGSAQWLFDGPRGGVYRAANGQYVYQDQVFNSLGEVNSIINAQGGGASGGGADTIRQGPDGQYYQKGANGWELIPGMPQGAAALHTTIQNIGGSYALIDTQTGDIIKVIGPAGSGSSGSGGSSSSGLITGRSPGVNTGTGSLVSSSSGYDQLAAQAAQREWQAGQNAQDRAERAKEFAATYGLSVAQYQLGVRDRADQAAKTYGELVSSADTAALPAYLAAGGGNLFNALSTGNSMLTDNAVRPGAMALDNARYYQGLLGGSSGGSTGGGGMPTNPFDPTSATITPTPSTLNPDGTVSAGGPAPAEGAPTGVVGGVTLGRERRGGSGLGGGAGTTYTQSPGGRRIPHFATMPSYSSDPMHGWGPDAAATAFAGYEQAQQMQYDQLHPETWNQAFPTLTPGSTYWQGGQLYYNTPNGPIPASMVDPYSMANGMQAGGSPFNSNAWLPSAQQQMVNADPRSQNPNLNLSPLAQSSYVAPVPGQAVMPGKVNNNGIQVPMSAATAMKPFPVVKGYANGGHLRGVGMVGERGPELVFAPAGATVVPMDKIAGHARGGAIDPFAPAGSSNTPPATDPLYVNDTSSESEPTQMTTMPIEPATPTRTGAPSATANAGAMMAGMQGGYGMAPQSWAQPAQQSPIQQAANPQPAPVASNENDQGAGTTAPPATTGGSGYTIINGPNTVPPGTPLPNPMSAEEVRRWRENFPIPTISGPYGALNPFDVAWANVDPTAREAFYNANQTRYGIPAASQAWEAQRFALPGTMRGGWGY